MGGAAIFSSLQTCLSRILGRRLWVVSGGHMEAQGWGGLHGGSGGGPPAGVGTVFRPDLELRADGRVEALLLGSSCCAR